VSNLVVADETVRPYLWRFARKFDTSHSAFQGHSWSPEPIQIDGDFLLKIYSNLGPISYRFWNTRRFLSKLKIRELIHPTHLAPTPRGIPLEFCNGGGAGWRPYQIFQRRWRSDDVCIYCHTLQQYHGHTHTPTEVLSDQIWHVIHMSSGQMLTC